MKDGKDHNSVSLRAVVNAKRKAGNRRLPDIAKHDWIAVGLLAHFVQNLLDTGYKVSAQTTALSFVSQCRFIKFMLRGRAKD